MDIKIIFDKHGPTGSDETSYAYGHFEVNPTMGEFIEYLKSGKEFGTVYLNNTRLFEYSHDIVTPKVLGIDKLMDKKIRLIEWIGGWGLSDYVIELE